MGCHGYGTLASAKTLTHNWCEKAARGAASQLKSGGDFYAVLEVEVD
ncbi:hypothetical protein [Archaeoglobus veneficus]|nr:hypothetical protein [Archaeoglobus veneficus]